MVDGFARRTVSGSAGAGAVDAGRDGRIPVEPFGRDLLAAAKAETEVAGRDALERAVDTFDFGAAPRGLRLGHRLDLHGVHSTEAPDALLVKLGRGPVAGPRRLVRLEFVAAQLEPVLHGLNVHAVHDRL